MTIEGDRLDQGCAIIDGRGFRTESSVPEEALPVCDECEKPELLSENVDAVILYDNCKGQQQLIGDRGHFAGVRSEAMFLWANHLLEAGEIWDIDAAVRGVAILDSVRVNLHNEDVDARIAAKEAEMRAADNS